MVGGDGKDGVRVVGADLTRRGASRGLLRKREKRRTAAAGWDTGGVRDSSSGWPAGTVRWKERKKSVGQASQSGNGALDVRDRGLRKRRGG